MKNLKITILAISVLAGTSLIAMQQEFTYRNVVKTDNEISATHSDEIRATRSDGAEVFATFDQRRNDGFRYTGVITTPNPIGRNISRSQRMQLLSGQEAQNLYNQLDVLSNAMEIE